MVIQPFCPTFGSTQGFTLAAATPQAANILAQNSNVRIWNSGAAKLYCCTYSSLATARVASAVDHVVPPGVISVISKDLTHDRISLFSAAGSTVEFSTGEGF